MDITNLPRTGQCKWVEGTGGADKYTFPCQNRVDAGISYCTEHHALVYIAPDERRRSRQVANTGFKRIAA